MSNVGVRIKKEDIPYDAFVKKAKLVNFGVFGTQSNFTTTTNNAGLFNKNTYLLEYQPNFNLNFTGKFTVSFWAKREHNYSIGNVFFIIFDDGTKMTCQYTIDKEWHHYSAVRDKNDDIIMRIDGKMVAVLNSTSPLNLNNNSYIGIGNTYDKNNKNLKIAADDIVILETSLWASDFDNDPLTDYLDLSKYRRFLYIVVSTGEVWGYK